MTVSYRQPGVVLTDRRFTVPLDHDDPAGETIELYAREVVASDKADQDLPWLVYLQGGPGFGANRFVGRQAWLGRALEEYRVLLLDQRGTGHSTPANRQTLPLRGGPAEQADYLAHFRADSIVRDCEADPPARSPAAPPGPSSARASAASARSPISPRAPEGLTAALITGGLPSLDGHADDVYRAAYPRIERKVAAHYARYPQDVERARRIADHLLAARASILPSGYRLTVEAFQSLGILLGGGEGSHRLHYLLEDAFVRTPQGPALSDAFQEEVQGLLSYAGPPAVRPRSTRRSTARTTAPPPGPPSGCAPSSRSSTRPRRSPGDGRCCFTGETVHPWMFDSDPALRPLRETAGLLAARTDWPPLYDPARLAANEVPVAAASTTTTCTSTPPTPCATARADPGPAHLGHGRVRARRRPGRRPPGPGPAAGAGPGRGVTRRATGA